MNAADFDTIVAPATPVGRSALAVVRVDGPAITEILKALRQEGLPEVRRATRAVLRHRGVVLDECVLVRYEAPESFTGNDLLELSLHGSPAVVQGVVAACLDLGARLAGPGEFTERAVLNGKLDLVQAEAVGALIESTTTRQARLSLANLSGQLSRESLALRSALVDVMARLEAALDFSDEGYDFIDRSEATSIVRNAVSSVEALLATYSRGRATTAGLEAVILGKPNAGKSTLLNYLVGSERAIVTPIAGTTRDVLRETVVIGGLPVHLSDTAGLRSTTDEVEAIGVERARLAAAGADLVLYLVDSTLGLDEEDREELAAVGGTARLVVYTKADLAAPPSGVVAVSSVTGSGLAELMMRLQQLVEELYVAPEGAPTVVTERQQRALGECRDALAIAADSLEAGAAEEMVAVDLRRAANSLGVLVGAISTDEVLGEIFSRFCIGK